MVAFAWCRSTHLLPNFGRRVYVHADIDPLADLTWMIERLHSNAKPMAPAAKQASIGLSGVRPTSTMPQWPYPCAPEAEIEPNCRFAEAGNSDVELRWRCTKPRSGLDKAGSSKSNISSYGTVATAQVRVFVFSERTIVSPVRCRVQRPLHTCTLGTSMSPCTVLCH